MTGCGNGFLGAGGTLRLLVEVIPLLGCETGETILVLGTLSKVVEKF